MKKSFKAKTVRPKEQPLMRFTLNILAQNNFYAVVKGNVIPKTDGRWQVWRNNTGSLRTASGGFMSAGYPGTPDIIGVAIDGKMICIEVKRDDKEKLSQPQAAFARISKNAYYFRVDCIEDALAVKNKLLEITRNYITLTM